MEAADLMASILSNKGAGIILTFILPATSPLVKYQSKDLKLDC